MKKVYIAPQAEVECCMAEVMQIALQSVGEKGNVQIPNSNEFYSDTNWKFGGDGNSTDNPDAKSGNLWDGWDD